jgi:hypothetical protein
MKMTLISLSYSSLLELAHADLPDVALVPSVRLLSSFDPDKFYTPLDHVHLCDGSHTTSWHQQNGGTTFFPSDRWVAASGSHDRQC